MEDIELRNLDTTIKDIEASSAAVDESLRIVIHVLEEQLSFASGENANCLKRSHGKAHSLRCAFQSLFGDFTRMGRLANEAVRKHERGEMTRDQVVVLLNEALEKHRLTLSYFEYAQASIVEMFADLDFSFGRGYAELPEGRSDSAAPSTASTPPKSAEYFLLLFLNQRDRENLIGDLAEEYAEIAQKHGAVKAKFWYFKQAATSVAPSIKKVLGFGVSASIGAAARRLFSYFFDLLK